MKNDKYGNLYVVDQGNHCVRKIVATCIPPNSPNSTTSATALNICYGQATTLSVLDPGLITWYDYPSGGTSLGTGFTFTTPLLFTDTVFYAEVRTCTSSLTMTAFPINVNSNPIITSTNDTTICNGSVITLNGGGGISYNWSGGVSNGVPFVPNVSSTYTVIGTDTNGCTATASTNIIVNTPDPSFNSSGAILSAVQSGAIYQWYNCDSNLIINNETNQNYNVTGSGTYALIINQGGCVDTSTCLNVTLTGNELELHESSYFLIYPNPASNSTRISFNEQEATKFELMNSQGCRIYEVLSPVEYLIINTTAFPPGVYYARLITKKSSVTQKLIIR
ncbi:MAG TPA: T9SS type A sorting domain-containing protein [Bacteroidia bacterium]|jgi:hypothetical protein